LFCQIKIAGPGISGKAHACAPAGPKKGIMKPNAGREYNKILINHWRWLQDQGPSYKQQASSCKLQAASLTRKLYNDIQEYTGEKKNENK